MIKWLGPEEPEQTKASAMPAGHGFWFDDNQDVAPRRPKTAEQSPKYSILDSQPMRLCWSEYAQLRTEGKKLKSEVVARMEEALRQLRMQSGIMGRDLVHRSWLRHPH